MGSQVLIVFYLEGFGCCSREQVCLCYKQMCVDLCSLQCIAVSFYTHSIMGEGSYMWQVLMNFPLFLSGCSCHLSGICQFIECDSIST